MEIENTTGKNLLGKIEEISLAATRCNLNFNNIKEVESQISEMAEFLGINHEQTVFFSCLAELSIQRTVSLESLAKHLKCSVLTLLNFINEIELLERKGIVQRIVR